MATQEGSLEAASHRGDNLITLTELFVFGVDMGSLIVEDNCLFVANKTCVIKLVFHWQV